MTCYTGCMAYRDPLDERARESRRKHYENNKDQYINRAKASKAEKRKYVQDLKEASPCVVCGEFYPYYVMQYDHIGSDKVSGVSALLNTGWKKLLDEIAKCELVCANCHAARTWQRMQDN